MKRYVDLYRKIISFENILLATRKARKGKRFKYSTALFEYNLEKNIYSIINALKNKTWSPGGYTDFYIYDPKKRLISAAPYYDRVVHHALISIIEPIIEKTFIYDSYACIKGKGTHKAVLRYKQFMRNNTHVLKCDIKKYFPNIDHAILYTKVENKIKCRDTLWLSKKIIDSKTGTDASFDYFDGDDLLTPLERKRGLPIGNLTSQFFANLYLNDFDHYVKETLREKYYIRYCDDFVLFGNSKKRLNEIKENIAQYLTNLRLILHDSKSRIYRVDEGVDFLGYRIFPEYSLVRKSVVKKIKRRLRLMIDGYNKNWITINRINNSVQSWHGHMQHANSYRLRQNLFSDIYSLLYKNGIESNSFAWRLVEQ